MTFNVLENKMDDWAGYRTETNTLSEEFKSELVQYGEINREKATEESILNALIDSKDMTGKTIPKFMNCLRIG
jgi:hypothetical protein